MPNESQARRPGEYAIIKRKPKERKRVQVDRVEAKKPSVAEVQPVEVAKVGQPVRAQDDFDITVDTNEFLDKKIFDHTTQVNNPSADNDTDGFDFPDYRTPEQILPKDQLHLQHDYVLTKKIGEGGMGQVWGAVRDDGEGVVIKKIRPELFREFSKASLEDFFKRMIQEGEILENLDSVHFPKFYEADAAGQAIVMERLQGVDLSKKIHNFDVKTQKRIELKPEEVAFIAGEVADGMALAHSKGFIHRDLKPANIFIEDVKDGVKGVKILDLGLAYAVESSRMQFRRASKKRLTSPGSAFGTPVYMSPEQVRGKADKPTDVYALGAVMYEMFTGDGPFHQISRDLDSDKGLDEAARQAKLWDAILKSKHKPLRELRPDLPEELLKLVDVMLTGEANDRPTMEQVRDHLEVFVHESKLGQNNRNEVISVDK